MSKSKNILDVKALSKDPELLAEFVREYTMYKEVFDSMPETVVIHDSQRRVITGNEHYKENLRSHGLDKLGAANPGTSFEDMRDILNEHGETLGQQSLGDKYYKKQIKIWNHCIETGEMIEYWDIQGKWLFYGVKKTPSGYFVDYRTDISEQKTTQLQFQQVLESTNQGVAILSGTGKIILLNSAFIKFWGLGDFDWRNKNVAEALDYAHQIGVIGQDCKTDDEWQLYRDGFIKSQTRIDGPSTFTLALDTGVRFKFTRILLPNRQALFLYDDITEIELQKEALEKAKLKAEAAERAKAEFLANMSHEIRTPMNGVMGMAEILMNTNLDPKQHSFADTIVRSGHALLTIINDILDFSKIGAGQMTLNPAPFNMVDAIEDVATLISTSAAEKNIELIVRIKQELPKSVIGDVGRIRQVLTNLIGNAVKFTNEGHVLVDVMGETAELEGHDHAVNLRIKVIDTGIGIPERQREKVFEKFSQVDSSAARKHEGTGLGLAIASSLVKLMGGEIGLESVVDEGSTFWFEITLPATAATSLNVAPIDISGSRVLIIDDNKVNRTILSELMDSWGFIYETASSGEEGLELAKSAHTQNNLFDLVILDYQMPDITGVEVAQRIRSDIDLKDMPIVLLTSVDQAAQGNQFTDLGLQALLTKPARSSLLLETIVTTLQSHNGESEQSIKLVNSTTDETPNTQPEPPISSQENNVDQTGAVELDDHVDILIVEDNEVNQLVFKQVIKSMKRYSLRIANNGQESIELYKDLSPSLILMDVSMPLMNGLQATAAIRDIERDTGHQASIIGVTAHAIDGDREKCIDCGMDDYLAKPISPAKLIEKIEKWMSEVARNTA